MKNLVVANWKMTPNTTKEVESYFNGFKKSAPKVKNTEIIFCPPFIYLNSLPKLSQIKIGAQDLFWENPKRGGSYTGEVSADMLKNSGVKYVIVGHSEKREYLNVTNEITNKKIKIALKAGLKVIFCVGEKERDKEGKYLKFIKQEIIEGLKGVSRRDLKNLVIAYEPIWAISSNKNSRADTPKEFLEASIYIRKVLFLKFGKKLAHEMPILYGGSVSFKNARMFLEEGGANGILIGRASWRASSFVKLLESIINN